LSDAEREHIVEFYRSLRSADGMTHEDAVRDTLVSILVSRIFATAWIWFPPARAGSRYPITRWPAAELFLVVERARRRTVGTRRGGRFAETRSFG